MFGQEVGTMLSEPDSGYFQARRFGRQARIVRHRTRRKGLGPCDEFCLRHFDEFDDEGPGRKGLGARDIDDAGPLWLIAVGLWLIAVGIASALTSALAFAFPLLSVPCGPRPPPIPIHGVESENFALPGRLHHGELPSMMAFSASDLPRRLRFATGTTIHRSHGVWPTTTDMLVIMPVFVPPLSFFAALMSQQVF